MRDFKYALPLIAAMMTAPVTTAQDVSSKWGLVAGAGVLVAPKYSGDDDYRIAALPAVRVSYGDNFWASMPEGVNYKFYEKGPLKLKAKADVTFSRDEEGDRSFTISGSDTNDLLGLGDINTTIELGADASYDFGPVKLSAGLRQGIGGHDSLLGDASLSYMKTFKTPGPPIALILTPNIKFGEADLLQAYYGVTPEQSLAAGLPEFRTDGGIYSVGINALTLVPTSRTSAFVLYGSIQELVDDAANSPLIVQRGSSTQASAGLFWVKAFGQDARNAERLVTGR